MTVMDYDGVIPDMHYFIYRDCTPNWMIGLGKIQFTDLTYVVEGEATYIINGDTYKVKKGDLICIPKNSLRQAETNPENPIMAYASNFYLYNLKGEEVSLPFPIVSNIGVINDLMPLYRELNLEWSRNTPGCGMMVRSIFLKILHRYLSILYYKDPINDINNHVKTAISFICENYKTVIEVENLANHVGLNPSYLGTLFKKSTGYSIKEYVNRLRIDTAENMLSSGEYSVKETATSCGFEDSYYFSKVFKKIKGYPPSKVIVKGITSTSSDLDPPCD
jgi:AraC-like DNA-binding protein